MAENYAGRKFGMHRLIGLDRDVRRCRDHCFAAGHKRGGGGLHTGSDGIIGQAEDDFRRIEGGWGGLTEDRHDLMDRPGCVRG